MYRRDRARYQAMRAAALAESGQPDEAETVLAAACAITVDSHIAGRELARARRAIDQPHT